MDFPSIFNNGVSPVETQNLASPVPDGSINVACNYSPNLHSMPSHEQSIAIYACDNPMTIFALLPCETQDFASLLLLAARIIPDFLLIHPTVSAMSVH